MDAANLDKLTGIFRAVLNHPDLTLSDELAAPDVPGWDSLNHLTLIVTIEEEFGVKFTAREVSDLHNVGELKALIDAKLGTA